MTQPQPNQLTKPLAGPEPLIRGDLPQVASAILKELGGHQGYANEFVGDLRRIRAGNPDIKPVQQERMIMSYHRLLTGMMAKKDQYELDTNELAGFSETELQTMLRDAALQNLKQDPAFRQEVLAVLSQQNPAETRQLLGVQVLEAEATPAGPADEPGYTEALDEPA